MLVGLSLLKSADKLPSADEALRVCPNSEEKPMLDLVDMSDCRLFESVLLKGIRPESSNEP
jgi:hypothetical protein